jgi:NhaP-type Na+/H+ or K+/H+ antiporter
VCAIATLTIGRMLPVAISLLGSGLKPTTVAFIGWFGPRGLASIVFGLLVIQEEALVGREELFSVIVLVIVASVVLHGMTAAPFADRYGHWFDLHGNHDMEESVEVEAVMLRGERRP